MSFLEDGGGILQIENSEKIAIVKFWAIYSSGKCYIGDSLIAYLFLGKFDLSSLLTSSDMDVSPYAKCLFPPAPLFPLKSGSKTKMNLASVLGDTGFAFVAQLIS